MTSDWNHFLNVALDILHLTAWFGVYVHLGEANFHVSCPLFSSLIYTESSFYSSESFSNHLDYDSCERFANSQRENDVAWLHQRWLAVSNIRQAPPLRSYCLQLLPHPSILNHSTARTNFCGWGNDKGEDRLHVLVWIYEHVLCTYIRMNTCTHTHTRTLLSTPTALPLSPLQKQQAGQKKKGGRVDEFSKPFCLLERNRQSWWFTQSAPFFSFFFLFLFWSFVLFGGSGGGVFFWGLKTQRALFARASHLSFDWWGGAVLRAGSAVWRFGLADGL